jgi:hypothetical protein
MTYNKNLTAPNKADAACSYFQKLDQFLMCTWEDGVLYKLDEWQEKSSFTDEEEAGIASELAELTQQYEATKYRYERQEAYPPIEDYVDGVVKGDQAQIDAYIAACQAVKQQFPKPE